MPLDGLAISNIAYEIEQNGLNCRVDKIHQPENDEIIIGLRGFGQSNKLLLSANSQSPRLHFTTTAKENPKTAPLFCMVLRKYLANGKIVMINQPGFERILEIHIESMNEMGDLSTKRLIIEIMGKHSNIILVDDDNTIIDSAKRVSFDKSSVRQVLPGTGYVYPPSQGKLDPMHLEKQSFLAILEEKSLSKLQEAVYKSYSGISPLMASEICVRAGLNPSDFVSALTDDAKNRLFEEFFKAFEAVKAHAFSPKIYFDENGHITDFSVFPMEMLESMKYENFSSISTLLESFYRTKDAFYRNSQRTQDLRKLVNIHIDRLVKKSDIQRRTLEDIEDRNFLKIQGELLTAHIYSITKGMTSITLANFYEENAPEMTIALDPTLSPSENAQLYFKKYNKQKRTYVAMQEQIVQTNTDLYYLESVLISLGGNLNNEDISEIRQELSEQGFAKRISAQGKKKVIKKNSPMHFVTQDDYHIYVGKNNKQNDELTLDFAVGNDIWLHTKSIPGSHVIIKSKGEEIPEGVINQAAHLAAYFSKGAQSSQVPIDYTLKKYVKKPAGAKPGMVIYDVYKTAYITPDTQIIEKINTDGVIL